MALVSDGFHLSVSLVDYGGNQTNKRWKMTAATYAAAVTDAAIVLAALNAVTDAVISAYAIAEDFVEDALSLPATINPVSVVASNTAYIDDAGQKKANFQIPSPNIGIFVGAIGDGADIVDGTDVAFLAYKALFDTGAQLLISDGESLGGFLRGVRVTLKRNLSNTN